MLSKKQIDTTRIDKIIEEVENAIIDGADPHTAHYTQMVDTLEKLYELKHGHKPAKSELKDWIPLIGSVGGIVAIGLFEAFGHILSTKSLSLVQKLKS